MRSPATLLRAAVAGAAAVVLLTACGGSSDEEPAATATSSATSSSAASSTPEDPTASPDPAAAEFCSEVQTVFADLTTAFQTATPEQLPTLLEDVIGAFDTVEAPPAIEADWTALGDALRQLQSSVAGLDLSTPEGQQAYAEAEAQLSTQVVEAQTNVTEYVVANCQPAAPTS
ncbi:nucleotidyl cyclase domain-containing protein [Geodermatophilus marinus]|uniref:hypothetical protein n=1 Tax=Geodermatophilus sp. LHW52908 TaxID=2303986 RepID=UPI000E3DEDB3|nr:hypothetical protein [Geodermatophilus sp. LHW52908]RFU23196.1 hypothetical protein D0Z06_00625 [Geodermatophilus sp. LHW52908]